MAIVVEGFDPDAIALARFLADEGRTVRLAGDAAEPGEAAELRAQGIHVEPHADLDTDPGPAEIAYLDVWTPDTAPRVHRLREQGTRVSCLADLVLERWPGPSIGITGTAGKTTTTSLVAAILRAAEMDVVVSSTARAGNLWPTGELLDRLRPGRREAEDAVLLLELTSSHLAFMHTSPTIAAVTSFWPDHLELHGDLARYRVAKQTIVRHQHAGDTVVVNADDPSADFAALTPAARVEFSLSHPVRRGAYLDEIRGVVLLDSAGELTLGPIHESKAHAGNVVAAAAIARAAGADYDAIDTGIRLAAPLPWRAQALGTLGGVPVVDDGMAATPLKGSATLAGYPGASVVLIAGGMNDAGGGPVHATREEHALLVRACDEIARAARLVVVFGAGGARLARLLRQRDVEIRAAADLSEAVAIAAGSVEGAAAVVFSPLFPVTLEDRARFAVLVREHDARP